jgi:hypothetical protein
MVNEEEIEILYNSTYGGWGISKKTFELYKLRSNLTNLSEFEKDFSCRNDPILIQIYKELGDDFDDKFSKSKIKKIPKKYENYYYIEEYDGKEFVKIDYIKYKLDNIYNKIKKILQSNNDNSIKLNEIDELISAFEM